MKIRGPVLVFHIFGVFLITFGIAEALLSQIDIDVWRDWIRINLPEPLWSFSSILEVLAGLALLRMRSEDDEVPLGGDPADLPP